MNKYPYQKKRVHFKLSQPQVVCGDTNHGSAPVGVLTDRNQERQFEMHPIDNMIVHDG